MSETKEKVEKPRPDHPDHGPQLVTEPWPAPKNEKRDQLLKYTETGGPHMTTNQGVIVDDDKNSLKLGARGPTLMEDFHFREKMTHFDHERIPERVVHARGSGAHGFFQCYEDLSDLTMASVLRDPSKKTPVFVRFSTVVGNRGSVDTPRDVRGFAVKFYTDEGVWDLVGNNIPVFFIQDGHQFPDLIHSAKPEPHSEVPQAQTAHDTFWDFVSLTPESTHMLLWTMSDRAIPRSYSEMEGFGVHTFRLVNAAGKSHFVKFHWKPLKGVHSLVWDEAQKIGGKDPDFNKRDLWEAIDRGLFPEWELGVQVVAESDEFKFDFDLLDATKIIPEEQVPVRRIGKMVLNRNPDNFFAETEQVAFHVGHVVPGIDFTNDPLFQARLFSYTDTQLLRLGPNFHELPINRSLVEVHNNQRDGHMRTTINKGRVSYFPNSLARGCPMADPANAAAFKHYAQKIDGQKIKERSKSFSDHFSQARLFWNSMSDWEQDHIIEAFSFELSMVESQEIRDRVVREQLANVDSRLAAEVARHVAVSLPSGAAAAVKSAAKSVVSMHSHKSPALSINQVRPNIKGMKIAIMCGDGVNGKLVLELIEKIKEEQAIAEVLGRYRGTVKGHDGVVIGVTRPASNAPSVIYDAVIIPSGDQSFVDASKALALNVWFVKEAFAHGKPIAAFGSGVDIFTACNLKFKLDIAGANDDVIKSSHGVLTATNKTVTNNFNQVFSAFRDALCRHRFFDRDNPNQLC